MLTTSRYIPSNFSLEGTSYLLYKQILADAPSIGSFTYDYDEENSLVFIQLTPFFETTQNEPRFEEIVEVAFQKVMDVIIDNPEGSYVEDPFRDIF